MGAAGYVTVYNEAAVRGRFQELFPEHDIDKDWWYLKTCSGDLQGTRYIFDYADDQGGHEGSAESFWFAHEEGEDYFADSRAQKRVQQVLLEVGPVVSVEVWT